MPQMALLTGGLDDLGCFMTRGGHRREASTRLRARAGDSTSTRASEVRDSGGWARPRGCRTERRATARTRAARCGRASRASRPTTSSSSPARATPRSRRRRGRRRLGQPIFGGGGGGANVTPGGQAGDARLAERGRQGLRHALPLHLVQERSARLSGRSRPGSAPRSAAAPAPTARSTRASVGQRLPRPGCKAVGALSGTGITLTGVADSVSTVNQATTTRWIYGSSAEHRATDTKYLSFETPHRRASIDAGEATGKKYCGKAVFTDLHAGGVAVRRRPRQLPIGGSLRPREGARIPLLRPRGLRQRRVEADDASPAAAEIRRYGRGHDATRRARPAGSRRPRVVGCAAGCIGWRLGTGCFGLAARPWRCSRASPLRWGPTVPRSSPSTVPARASKRS